MSGKTKIKKVRTSSIKKDNKAIISVCLGTGGIAAGGENVFAEFDKEIKSKKAECRYREACV